MHFDRTAYFDGDITLLFAEPLPVDVEVNVAVEGDFMSTERFDYDFVLKAAKRVWSSARRRRHPPISAISASR